MIPRAKSDEQKKGVRESEEQIYDPEAKTIVCRERGEGFISSQGARWVTKGVREVILEYVIVMMLKSFRISDVAF